MLSGVRDEQGNADAGCLACGGVLRWESIVEGEEERWLGICVCGWMRVFVPARPDLDAVDPLTVFVAGLGAERRPLSPPWVRVFRVSQQEPWLVDWLYCSSSCPACGAGVAFGTRRVPRPGVAADCLLCLACGWVSVEYRRPQQGLVELPAVGTEWLPACPAVQRLRICLFRPWTPASFWTFEAPDGE